MELGFGIDIPTPVRQDNLCTIEWTEELQGIRNVKHVSLRYNFVKENVQRKDIEVFYTPFLENKADSMMKGLGGSRFTSHRQEKRVMSSLEGGLSHTDKLI